MGRLSLAMLVVVSTMIVEVERSTLISLHTNIASIEAWCSVTNGDPSFHSYGHSAVTIESMLDDPDAYFCCEHSEVAKVLKGGYYKYRSVWRDESPVRCCNRCNRPLAAIKRSGRDVHECRSCDVLWWGQPGSLPANSTTRRARQELFALIQFAIKNCEIYPTTMTRIGCFNQLECFDFAKDLIASNAGCEKMAGYLKLNKCFASYLDKSVNKSVDGKPRKLPATQQQQTRRLIDLD